MPRFIQTLIAAAGLVCLSSGLVSSPVQANSAQEVMDKHKAELDKNIERGKLIYEYDQAAWHSTDAMRQAFKDPAKAGMRGYVISELADEGQYLAVYYGQKDDVPYGIYSAIYDGSEIRNGKILEGEEQQLTDIQKRLIKAREMAYGARLLQCSKSPFNTVAIPAKTAGAPDTVYFLTPQTETDKVPFGGHNRLEIKDGKIVSQRQFTNSCLEVDLKGPDGQDVEMIFVTHILDPYPTEIHVFTAYTTGHAVGVMTIDNEILWFIDPKSGTVGNQLLAE